MHVTHIATKDAVGVDGIEAGIMSAQESERGRETERDETRNATARESEKEKDSVREKRTEKGHETRKNSEVASLPHHHLPRAETSAIERKKEKESSSMRKRRRESERGNARSLTHPLPLHPLHHPHLQRPVASVHAKTLQAAAAAAAAQVRAVL